MFENRLNAGHTLAEKLISYRGTGVLVLGLARGGVVVARTVAQDLSLPLDVLVVKKISSPENIEFALGALAPDGVSFINWKLVQRAGIDEQAMRRMISQLSQVIQEKMLLYRKGKKPLLVRDKVVIIVDDGMATGASFEAAIKWCKAKKAKKIIIAVPVANPNAISKITPEVDVCVVVETPNQFESVGMWYKEFAQVTDQNVIEYLL